MVYRIQVCPLQLLQSLSSLYKLNVTLRYDPTPGGRAGGVKAPPMLIHAIQDAVVITATLGRKPSTLNFESQRPGVESQPQQLAAWLQGSVCRVLIPQGS